jgi:SAM-dependent methyltransferase
MTDKKPQAEFDAFADSYSEALERGLSVSGEGSTFFARGRIAWLARCLAELNQSPRSVLDYGCGTGGSVPLFIDLLHAESVVGVDPSEKSLEAARRTHAALPARFLTPDQFKPSEQIDLAFCNGVLHHVPLSQRQAAVSYIAQSLRPGGLFALWENNRWNPGTRYVMSRIPFDRDAVMLATREATSLVQSVGFHSMRVDYAFVFPKWLGWLRRIEPSLARLPLGAQYQVLSQKPSLSGE